MSYAGVTREESASVNGQGKHEGEEKRERVKRAKESNSLSSQFGQEREKTSQENIRGWAPTYVAWHVEDETGTHIQ